MEARKSLFIVAVLGVLILCGSAFAGQYGGGSGTAANPYLIYTTEQLNAIGANLGDKDKHFKLMADIDLSIYTGDSFNIIGPSGSVYEMFTGTFDGNGHEISNFSYIGGNRTGIFGYVKNAQIKDLGLKDPNVDAGTEGYGGALVGFVNSGLISGCYVEGGRISGDGVVGGLVGRNYGMVINCHSTVNVVGDLNAGGLVGTNDGTISKCSSGGNVTGYRRVGVLVGWNEGTVVNCYSMGSASGSRKIGGLVGNNAFGSAVSDCYSSGSVSGNSNIGGLIGHNVGSVTNCYSVGNVTGDTVIGGLLGSNNVDYGIVTDSFWNVETSGQTSSASGTGKTTTEMQTESTFTSAGWDFETPIWKMCGGPYYPRLFWEKCPELVGLEIEGPNEVAENFQVQYKAIAHYDNGSTRDVTDLAVWSVDDETIANIEAGLLTTEPIDLPQDIMITAQYSEGDINESAEKQVSVLTICPSGSALEFDGVDDYVELENTFASVTGSATKSVMAWAKSYTTDYSSGSGRIITLYRESGSTGFTICAFGNPATWKGLYRKAGNTSQWFDSGVYVTANEWINVALVQDGANVDIYINGLLENNANDGAVPTLQRLVNADIGAYDGEQHGMTSFFNGAIDEVAIYDRALTAEEIRALMHTRPESNEPNLIGYWDFDEGEGQVAHDLSPYANNGRLGSTPQADDSDPAWVESDAPVGICTPVAIDIKPGSCPNPLNLASRGVLPAAILGTEDFDVTTIDPASIFLDGVAAIRSSYEDVATPVVDGNECECTTEGPDGYTDLTLKFRTQEIVEGLINGQDELADGQTLTLTLTGELFDDTAIEGADCVVLVGNVPRWLAAKRWDANADGVVNFLDFAVMAEYWLESCE